MSDREADVNEKGKPSRDRILLIVAVIVIVALAVAMTVIIVNGKKTVDAPSSEAREIVNEKNVESIMARAQESANEEEKKAYHYIVTMRDTVWNFENSHSASPDSWVQNAPENETPVYFNITRDDTGETIYKSPVIPIGKELDEVKLDTELAAGTYECTMEYSLLEDDMVTVITHARVALTIVIKN